MAGTGGEPSEIPAAAYDVIVFDNRFPSFRQVTGEVPPEIDDDLLWPQRLATSCAEVICFTSDHDAAVSSLPRARLHGYGGVGGPDGEAVSSRWNQAGLPVREPGPGAQGVAAAPARADLRLPLRHPPHRAAAPPGRGTLAAHGGSDERCPSE